MLYVIDIDGTCADGAERFAKAGPEPDRTNKEQYTKWVDKVNFGMENDKAVPGMVQLITAMIENGHIVFATSREERHRKVTEKWLKQEGFPVGKLVMRPNDCWSNTADLKEIIIAANRDPWEAVIVIDDDEHGTIEAMCKRNGYTFLKARSGGQTGGK
jgi:hypothetical protein